MKKQKVKPKFVEFIPHQMKENILYISIEYSTASHKCMCGCGHEVVTPISPKDWKLSFDGETVSLHPSIGNWSFDCKSHYWIKNNEIIWAESWDKDKISSTRAHDRIRKQVHYASKKRKKDNNWFWRKINELWK